MQTFIVHNRQPRRLWRELGWQGFIGFEVVILGMILAPLLHAAFMVALGLRLAFGAPLVSPGEHWLAAVYFAVLVLGSFAAFALHITGLARLGRRELIATQLLLPFYWLLLAAATLRALRELLLRPFHWAKSTHRPARGTAAPAPDAGRAAALGRR